MVDMVTRAERSRIMALVRSKDTTPELTVRRLVHSMGYRYRLHVRSLPGSPDLVFSRHRKIIFVSGCFWHMHTCGRCRVPQTRRAQWLAKLQRNRSRDVKVRRQLRGMGYSVLTIWECQTRDAEKLTKRLKAFLSAKRR